MPWCLAGLICYVFRFVWQLFGRGQECLFTAVAVINSRFIRFVVYNFVVKHISVEVHNGHVDVSNFYIDPVKKPIQLVMRREMLI